MSLTPKFCNDKQFTNDALEVNDDAMADDEAKSNVLVNSAISWVFFDVAVAQ